MYRYQSITYYRIYIFAIMPKQRHFIKSPSTLYQILTLLSLLTWGINGTRNVYSSIVYRLYRIGFIKLSSVTFATRWNRNRTSVNSLIAGRYSRAVIKGIKKNFELQKNGMLDSFHYHKTFPGRENFYHREFPIIFFLKLSKPVF